MISSKYITVITTVLVVAAILLCAAAMGFSDMLTAGTPESSYSPEYESKLFDTDEIIDINIVMDSSDWDEMLSSAIAETYHSCDVVINGTEFYSVGIRPKGNTSLSSIANDPDNNRYSFKLEFDQFISDQTCWGLDKLILNNGYADTTNMKETVIYDMFQFLDADASLYNYARLSVNGEYWGVYLALEAVEESFMLRNYGTEKGYLYKPDGMDMGRRKEDGGGGESPGFGRMPDMNGFTPRGDNMPEENESRSDALSAGSDADRSMPASDGMNGMRRGGMGGGNGANLNYTDDSLDSYSTIWESSVNGSSEADHRRVVTALKNISTSTDLEKYLDVDNVLRYMAVHNFSVNDDSLSGSMAHNYYLYESNGMLNILPWDYNLAFGGMHGNDASAMINDPIDDSYSSTQFFDALLQNEQYLEKYHEYYDKLVEEYVCGGGFDKTYQRVRSQIDLLVQTDPGYMYTYDEYLAGCDMLYNTVLLRAQSVRGQLSGTIPATSKGQMEDSSNLVDASSIDVSVMGRFMNGGPGENRRMNGNRDNSSEVIP